MMAAQPCEYTKNHGSAYFKMVNPMVCELYQSKSQVRYSVKPDTMVVRGQIFKVHP